MSEPTNQYRTPSERVALAAVPGAVIIATPEGNVVITPEAARQMLKELPRIVDSAEIAGAEVPGNLTAYIQ